MSLLFTFSLLSATSSTRPTWQKRILTMIIFSPRYDAVHAGIYNIPALPSKLQTTNARWWPWVQIEGQRGCWAEMPARLGDVLPSSPSAPSNGLLQKIHTQKRPQKQDNPDLYPIRNPCAQCSFIHTNLKIRRLHHLSQGGSVKKRYIKMDCVLLHREIVMYNMVGHPIITGHGENTATSRAGGEAC